MRLVTRMVLLLLLATAGGMLAQDTSAPVAATTDATGPATGPEAPLSPAPPDAPPPVASASSHDVRNEFAGLLRQHPQELATILALDPTLLSNEGFLAGYPQLAAFVAEHPEVRRNPRFFLGEFVDRESNVDKILEPIMIIGVFALIAFALAWFVRTIIEQKRWSRLSRIQTEVHNKILDRFGTSAELLEYVRSPAGTKFLESAPIPLHAEQPTPNTPLARVMWSIQIGVIVAAGAIGMLIVSFRLEKEASAGLFALGAIGLCVGAGFVASALVSIYLSRRLGPSGDPSLPPEPGLVK